MRFLPALTLAVALGACGILDVGKQQEKIDATCRLSGRVDAERIGDAPLIVVLARKVGEDPQRPESWQVADHFVLERPGLFGFAASAGTYGVAAFQDLNHDLKLQPDEPYLRIDRQGLITCQAGERRTDLVLRIPAKGRSRLKETLDIASLQVRSFNEQLDVSLAQVTAIGEIANLSDPRFDESIAEDGLWRPFDFLFKGHPGVYFLGAYDSTKVPVLFVHGINGTPQNFRTLIERMDRTRFQPWVYYYPSGAHLPQVADHLTQTMRKLQVQYGFKSFVVVAHSMGGLVSRGFVQRHAVGPQAASIPLLVTISTPWGGHKGAQLGVDTAPVVVRVWEDMAPGSAYQRSLYSTPLPAATKHHLVFTFNRKSASFGESDDQVVTVASQLLPQAQRDAAQLHGFDENHTSVLRNPQVALLVNQLLAGAFERTSP